MQMNYEFDATQYTPSQGGGAIHPVGRFPFVISKTEIVGNQAGTGGYLQVTYKTPEGEISDRFNLWHENPVTVRIAHEQLAALSYVTGVMKISMQNEGAALLNAQGMIEVVKQTSGDGAAKGYTQVAKRLDRNGNEPNGQGGAPQQQNGPGNGGAGFQPPQGNGPGNAGPGGFQPPQNGQPQGNPPANNGGASWGNNAPQGGGNPPANGQPGGWQQGGNGGGQPSWGQR
jgi:hypothetical protein